MSRHSEAYHIPFDRFKTPPRQNAFLMPLIWSLSYLFTRGGRLKIKRDANMKGLKPPFIVYANHLAFMDFMITPLALFPHRANYISELEGFENFGEWLYRQAGCLGTRKFVSDLALIKSIKKVVDRGDIIVIYPEARYANVGTSSALPDSVGKLAKLLKLPVVTLTMKGSYLHSPIWNLTPRKGARLEAEITQVFTAEALEAATPHEITEEVKKRLTYNEYDYQLARQLKIPFPQRAEGLELVLYQCPACRQEFSMHAHGERISCSACGSAWRITELGELELVNPQDSSYQPTSIPDWYEWQRKNVEEAINAGEYSLSTPVQIDALPNAKRFYDLGQGRLTHTPEGFRLYYREWQSAEEASLFFPASSTLSVHTEYAFRKKGQCITLSTLDNTYFIFPQAEGFNATKIQFATEYLCRLTQKERQR